MPAWGPIVKPRWPMGGRVSIVLIGLVNMGGSGHYHAGIFDIKPLIQHAQREIRVEYVE